VKVNLRALAAAAVIAALVSLSAATLRAFCSTPTPKVCSWFFASDVVFVARVLSRQYADNDQSIRFDVRVSRILRGSVGQRESVYTGNDSARLLWDIGREYVVFARREGRRLVSGDVCGPVSDEFQDVADIVRQIHALSRKTTGSIEGDVLVALELPEGIPGVPVRVTNGHKTYAARSNSKGQFHLDVPPGRYRVIPDRSVKPSGLNWESLSDVRLVAGQCAQYTFLARHPERK
jgi:hypothetical protein